MKIETKYNIGDEVILSGIQCTEISGILVDESGVKYVGGSCTRRFENTFPESDVLCLKSEFLNVFGKKAQEADGGK